MVTIEGTTAGTFLPKSLKFQEMENNRYAVIKVNPATKERFEKLCERYNYPKVEMAEKIFHFMEVTGYHPDDTTVQTPGEEIKKLRNTLVSFMRKQESDILKPMVNQMDEAVQMLVRFVKTYDGESSGFPSPKLPQIQTEKQPLPQVSPATQLNKKPIEKKEENLEKPASTDLLAEKEAEIKDLKARLKQLSGALTHKATGMDRAYVLNISKSDFQRLFRDL